MTGRGVTVVQAMMDLGKPCAVCLLFLWPATVVAATEIVPTGCRFTGSFNGFDIKSRFGPALIQLAKISDAEERGDLVAATNAARRAGSLVATYNSSNDMITMLDVTSRLEPNGIKPSSKRVLAKEILNALDPIARQGSEIDTGFFRAYLLAHEHIHGSRGEDHLVILKQLWDKIAKRPICFERRFFLRLQLANAIGDTQGRTMLRRYAVALRTEADVLKGVGGDHHPMKWYGLNRLTILAMKFHEFGLANAWLVATTTEAHSLLARPELGVESRRIIGSIMDNLHDLVAQQEDRYNRAESVGLTLMFQGFE
jgi:hypothetical protein